MGLHDLRATPQSGFEHRDISLVPSLVLTALVVGSLGTGLSLTSFQRNFQDLLSYDRHRLYLQARKLATNRMLICKLMQNRRLQTHL